jgi:hypothetical protein
VGSKRTTEKFYSPDDMLEIIMEFATHIRNTYDIHSKAIRMPMDITPQAMVLIWQNDMENKVAAQTKIEGVKTDDET